MGSRFVVVGIGLGCDLENAMVVVEIVALASADMSTLGSQDFPVRGPVVVEMLAVDYHSFDFAV